MAARGVRGMPGDSDLVVVRREFDCEVEPDGLERDPIPRRDGRSGPDFAAIASPTRST